jgi:glutathione S-transferase
MILIGRYLSPYVRRVATTLNFYNMPFEHQPLQHTGDDAPHLRKINPIGRVPALVVSDDNVVVESAAILDYLDREVGAERALIPAAGDARTRAMSMLGVATGSIDKAISCAYEVRFRPEEKRHAPWSDRCAEQAAGGYTWLESQLQGDWFGGDKMSQVDITVAVGWQFMGLGTPQLQASIDAPRIAALTERLMQLEAFSSTYPG